MYQPSAAFVSQMDTRPFRVRLTGAGGGRVQVDELEYTAGWCPSAFSLGNACSAGFTARLTAAALPLARGEEVALEAALLLEDGSEEGVPMGKFTLTKVERETDGERYTLTGEDAMAVALEEEFFCADPAQPPATALAVLQEICARCGLALAGAELVPEAALELKFDAAGGAGSTMRALVGQAALMSGANALIDRDGALRLLRFRDTAAAFGPERYYESDLTVEAEDFVFGALEVTVPGSGEEGAQGTGAVYSAQLPGRSRGIAFQSAAFTQEVFDWVWQSWQGEAFRPAAVTFLGNVLLDPGDRVAVTDRAGQAYCVPAMGLKHSFDGGFRTTLTAYGPQEEAGGGAAQTVSQAITGLRTELGRFKNLYADNLTATNAVLRHITTEDITGEHGVINLAQGTFQFGDALTWDGEELVIRGTLETGQGSIGGWEIGSSSLYRTVNWSFGSSQTGDRTISLLPGEMEESPSIYFEGNHWDAEVGAAQTKGWVEVDPCSSAGTLGLFSALQLRYMGTSGSAALRVGNVLGSLSGIYGVEIDGALVVDGRDVAGQLGGVTLRAGTKVVTASATPSCTIFTSAQLNTLFGTSGVTYGQGNSLVLVANGDWAAQNKNVVAMFANGGWYMRTSDGSNLAAGSYRVNYLAVTW